MHARERNRLLVEVRLSKVVRYMHDNVAVSMTLAEAAAIAGFERTYFCRLFKRHVGMRFSVWAHKIRIDRAKRELALNALSVTEIAFAVGYGDITTFERNFKKFEGTSPARFRRSRSADRSGDDNAPT